MKEKKLLGFQEEERRREAEAAEAKKLEKRLEEERQRRKLIMESGERPITTPKVSIRFRAAVRATTQLINCLHQRVRNVQALYESPARKSASPSPLRRVLPSSAPPRSRTASDASFKTPLASPSPPVPYKRLSLSMGSSTSTPATPIASSQFASTATSTSAATDDEISHPTPERSSKSLRIPLSTPPQQPRPGVPPSSLKRMLGSLGGMVARRKREESILSLLRSESDQRKKRESVK
jgi:hypothetical protein